MAQFQGIINAWSVVSKYLSVPSNEDDLNRLIEFSDYLMDIPSAIVKMMNTSPFLTPWEL